MKRTISAVLEDLFPKWEGEVPKQQLFTTGEMFRKDEPAYQEVVKKIAESWREAHDADIAWKKQNRPLCREFGERLLFVVEDGVRTKVYSTEFPTEKNLPGEISICKQDLALLLLFLRHGGRLEAREIEKSVNELQGIYTTLRDTSVQIGKPTEYSEDRNDWFHKMVAHFNRTQNDDNANGCALPERYCLRIYTPKEREELFNEVGTAGYSLLLDDLTVKWGRQEYDDYCRRLASAQPGIEKELENRSPIERNRDSIDWEKVQQRWLPTLLKLGEAVEKRRKDAPGPFETWYYKYNRTCVIMDPSEWGIYEARCGEASLVKAGPIQRAIIALFLRHRDRGITLEELRAGGDLNEELNDIYHMIKGDNRKTLTFESGIRTRPNMVLLDHINKTNKALSNVSIVNENGLYYLSGVNEVVTI